MSFTIRPAIRENVGLFIGLAGGTGSGKTMSAMKMAKGIVGPGKRFCVIDTENRRALHYADMFEFDTIDLPPPHSPERYEEAMKTAIAAGYKAIIVDSGSHEHDGHGGYLDIQAEELAERVERMRVKAKEKGWSFNEWDAIDKATPLSWQKGKRQRKRMMQTGLECSTSIPVLWCFRAEEKVFTSKDGKLVANNPPIWAPMCGKGMPFEMTVFFMLHREKPGVPTPIKLEDQHKALFPLDKPLNEATGRAIAVWAAGEAKALATSATESSSPAPGQSAPLGATAGEPARDEGDKFIAPEQVIQLEQKCTEYGIPVARLCAAGKVSGLKFIERSRFQASLDWIARRAAESRSI